MFVIYLVEDIKIQENEREVKDQVLNRRAEELQVRIKSFGIGKTH